MNNNLGKQTKVLTNKFGLFARILVCLQALWFVCQQTTQFDKTIKKDLGP